MKNKMISKSIVESIISENAELQLPSDYADMYYRSPTKDNLMNDILNSPQIKIDSVVNYFSEIKYKNTLVVNLMDFPNVMPPFDKFWMEWDYKQKGTMVGILFGDVENRPKYGDEIITHAKVFVYERGEKKIYLGAGFNYTCHADGSPKWWLGATIGADDLLGGILGPCLLAISFMHCKNIVVKRDTFKDHEIREYRKHHNHSPIKFYTLEIEPMKKILKTEGGLKINGLKKALHICRGHFKSFENGPGLFGSIHGTYWWPSQVRGSKDHGIIVKDYSIKLPHVEVKCPK